MLFKKKKYILLSLDDYEHLFPSYKFVIIGIYLNVDNPLLKKKKLLNINSYKQFLFRKNYDIN